MVEIHTHHLNKDLIKICKDKIDELQKQMTSQIHSKLKQLLGDLISDRSQFESTSYRDNNNFQSHTTFKKYGENLYDFRDYKKKE